MRVLRQYRGLLVVIGPWMAAINWDPASYGYGWRDGDGWLTRKTRRVFSGWHRWNDDIE